MPIQTNDGYNIVNNYFNNKLVNTVDLLADLRAIPSGGLEQGYVVIVGGAVTVGDTGGSTYRWDFNSQLTIDGSLVVGANDRPVNLPGRWIKIGYGAPGSKGDQGIKGDKGDTGDVTPAATQAKVDAQTAATNSQTSATNSANSASASLTAAQASSTSAAQAVTTVQQVAAGKSGGSPDITLPGNATGPFSLLLHRPVQDTGTIQSISVRVNTTGTYRLIKATVSSGNVTFVETADVALVSGSNTVTTWNPAVTAGVHFLGYAALSSAQSIGQISFNGMAQYSIPGTVPTIGTATAATTNNNFTPALRYTVLPTKSISDRIAQVEADNTYSFSTTIFTTGPDLSISGAVNGSASATYISGSPIGTTGKFRGVNVQVNGAGGYFIFVATRSGLVFSAVANKYVTLATGQQYVDLSTLNLNVTAGVHYVGIAGTTSSTFPMYRTPGTGTFFFGSTLDDAPGSTFQQTNNYDMMINAVVAVTNLDTTNNNVTVLQGQVTQLNGQLQALNSLPTVTPLANVDKVTLLQNTSWNATIGYGQSLIEGVNSTPVLSTTQPYSNLTFGSGPKSGKAGSSSTAANTSPGTSTVKPLVEDTGSASGYSTGETVASGGTTELNSRLAKENSISPNTVVQLASIAGHGAYTQNSLKKGAVWYQNMLDHISDGIARAKDATKDYQLTDIPYFQGEADADANTSRATYLATLRQMRADIEADYWTRVQAAGGSVLSKSNPVHYFVFQLSSWGAGGAGVTLSSIEQISLAQSDADSVDPRINLIGPGYPFKRVGDQVHLTNLAELTAGHYWGRARKQVLFDGRKADRFKFLSATAQGTTVTIKCQVPTLPILLDITTFAKANDFGMVIKDDTGALTLSNIQVVGSTITATTNRALGTNPKFRYALDQQGTAIGLAGPWGNVRDSTVDGFVFNNTSYGMLHWAPHAEMPIWVLAN